MIGGLFWWFRASLRATIKRFESILFADKNIAEEHLDTMNAVLKELKNGKTWTDTCNPRHEQISKDMANLGKIIDDHEIRIRIVEHWDGRERRK